MDWTYVLHEVTTKKDYPLGNFELESFWRLKTFMLTVLVPIHIVQETSLILKNSSFSDQRVAMLLIC